MSHSTVVSFTIPMVGKTLGKYRILDKIGGGMGLYRGSDETLDREVAIKVISPELTSDGFMVGTRRTWPRSRCAATRSTDRSERVAPSY
jgi:hypothetical protein